MELFQDNGVLFDLLGSFWTQYYQDRNFVRGLQGGVESEGAQTYLDFMQRIAALSRFDVPVFRKEYWVFLPLRKSEENAGNASVIRYGDVSLAYGDGSIYGGFGKPKDYIFDLPAGLKTMSAVTNRLTNASVVWVNGADFTIENGAIVFPESPFENDLIAQRPIINEDGVQVDREVGLWAYLGEWDLQWIWDRFGFAVGLWLQSSQAYKDLVNALWDMRMFGGTELSFRMATAAITGIPCVQETTETVKNIITYSDTLHSGRVVVTDQHSYTVPVSATLTVSEGSTVHAGDTLVDTWELILLNQKNRDISNVKALALSPSFLSGGYRGNLVFNNLKVDLEYVGIDADGKTFVKFEVGGYTEDTEKFWQTVQTAGKTGDYNTLAEYLDIRNNPAGQPGPGDLPQHVNPLDFLLDNVFKNNLFLLRVKPQEFVNSPDLLRLFTDLRYNIPANTTFILVVDLTVNVDELDLETNGDVIEEDTSLLTGASIEDTIEAETAGPSFEDGHIKFIGGDQCNA